MYFGLFMLQVAGLQVNLWCLIILHVHNQAVYISSLAAAADTRQNSLINLRARSARSRSRQTPTDGSTEIPYVPAPTKPGSIIPPSTSDYVQVKNKGQSISLKSWKIVTLLLTMVRCEKYGSPLVPLFRKNVIYKRVSALVVILEIVILQLLDVNYMIIFLKRCRNYTKPVTMFKLRPKVI